MKNADDELARVVAAIDDARQNRALAATADMRRYWWGQLDLALARYNDALRVANASISRRCAWTSRVAMRNRDRVMLADGRFALIDEEDFDRVCGLSWSAGTRMRGAVTSELAGKTVFLRRFILGAQPGQLVVNVNGDNLDCRKENLHLGRRRRVRRLDPGDKGDRIVLFDGRFALVDAEDFDRVDAHCWRFLGSRSGPAATIGALTVLLRRFVLDATRGEFVTNVNRDLLDCRKENLRRGRQYQMNGARAAAGRGASRGKRPGGSSRFKGVYWSKKDQRWRAKIQQAGRIRHLGNWLFEEDAARAYDAAAAAAFGPNAWLNFPDKAAGSG